MDLKIIEKVDSLLKNNLDIDKYNVLSFEESGRVIDINDSIIIAKGFSVISFEECVLIKDKFFGIVSLIDNDVVKIILLNKTNEISIGDKVVRTRQQVHIPVGYELLGRVVNPLGEPLDNLDKPNCKNFYPMERKATKILDRQSVNEPLQTGVKVIDSLIPIGKGQRELILGDRQTGKTTIAIDTILNQKNNDVICIYCSIGQRDNSVANLINILRENGAMDYTVVMHSSGSDSVGQQYIAPYSATSMAEYFMEQGRQVLIIYDDLSKHAKAYRELSLLLEKNPGREAYPADIFYIHSKLLERATKLKDDLGGGSLTALPIVETEAENMSAYIPTNIISITDGQIYLSPTLFQKGILPAIDISKSVSRVGSSAQLPAMKQTVNRLGIEFSQFEELESFSKFSTTLDEETRHIIDKGKKIREIFKQKAHMVLDDYEEIAIFMALNGDIFDDIETDKINELESLIIETINDNEFSNIKGLTKAKMKIPEDDIVHFLDVLKNKLKEKNE